MSSAPKEYTAPLMAVRTAATLFVFVVLVFSTSALFSWLSVRMS